MTTSDMTTNDVLSSPPAAGADAATLASVERQVKIAALLTAGFGLLFAVGSHDATDGPVRFLADLLFLRLGDGPGELTNTNHLADAILGGVMAGWGAMMWLLADRLLTRMPSEVKSILTISLLVWFPIDSLGSIASGAWLNAISNIAFAAMFLVPLRRL